MLQASDSFSLVNPLSFLARLILRPIELVPVVTDMDIGKWPFDCYNQWSKGHLYYWRFLWNKTRKKKLVSGAGVILQIWLLSPYHQLGEIPRGRRKAAHACQRPDESCRRRRVPDRQCVPPFGKGNGRFRKVRVSVDASLTPVRTIREERVKAEEYVDFHKRTDSGSQ